MATTGTGIGVFENAETAENALNALYKAGFNHEHIYISKHHTSGGFLSGVKKAFTGEDSTSEHTVADDLSAMGLPDDEVQYYEQEYEAGHPVIAVKESGREQEAANILQENGAHAYNAGAGRGQTTRSTGTTRADMDRSTTEAGTGTGHTTRSSDPMRREMDRPESGMGAGGVKPSMDPTRTDMDRGIDPSQANIAGRTGMSEAARSGRARDIDEEGARNVRLREEQLRVEKERVQTGEVGLHKEVVTEQQSIDVPVSHEEVYIERHPVGGGNVDDSGVPLGQDETINIPLSGEQVRVSKETKATGEVSIGKHEVEGTQQVSDAVKHEEARVEQQGNSRIREGKDSDTFPPDKKGEKRI
ncbi:YsnF/AvaK domain-containing protein [Dictyobacter arantiisoli]|uniref:DUF2382 domain-containing protein n=1 Tax=Dictyobacter arantiisoli TaxID=2014874 RepID=A0A5A5TGG5_9CHLR|nr:YsnF/AvaK domain-containing protein [Dictyobacter arantiisoli]GCF10457.1 hypothetical protein KDI_40210 [Dictyobacter arantiisoli]